MHRASTAAVIAAALLAGCGGGNNDNGKTGTAQRGEGQKPDAWFVSFASSGDRDVAVAVVIENGAANSADISGGRLAAPIAKDVMEAVLGR